MKKQTSFLGDIARLASGTVIAQMVSFLVTPILARLYGPEHFGTYAIFVAITGILAIIACFRYDYAVLLPKENNEAVNLLLLCLASAFVVFGVTGIILWFVGERVVNFLNAADLYPFLWWIPLAVLINGLFLALRSWLSRNKRFEWISSATVVATLSTAFFQLVLGLLGKLDAGSLIAANTLGSIMSLIVISACILKHDTALLMCSVDWRGIWNVAVRYRKFPMIDSWGAFINSLSWQLPPLMLSFFFNQSVVGYYSLAYRLVHVPISLVGNSIAQVFYQRVSELKAQSESIGSIVESTFHQLSRLGLLPALVATIVGQELIVIAFGSQWSESGKYFQILSVWTFFWFAASPLSTVFTVLEKQELLLTLNITNLITRYLAFYVGGYYQNPYIALGLFAFSGIAVYGSILVLALIYAKVKLLELFQKQKINLISSIVGGLIFVSFKLQYPNSGYLLIIFIASCLIAGNWFVIFFPKIRKRVTESYRSG